MEDQEREMAGAGREDVLKAKPKADPAARRWTVMIMGRVGKVRSFKVSPRVLLLFFLFLALYLPLSVVVFNEWVDLRRDNRAQRDRILQLREDLARAERTLFKFQQHVSLLESYIVSMKEEKGPPVEAEPAPAALSSPAASPSSAESIQTAPPPEPKEPEERSEPPEPATGFVDIKQMAITSEEGRVKVNFNLVNIDEGEDAVSGYIHILASGRYAGTSWWEVYPRGDVKDGMPRSYRAGQPFIIQRFKPIHGEFDARTERGAPDSIRVVVYDDRGRLIFEKAYEVENAS